MLNIHGLRDIIKTRWVVITGAPSSGKTTLIKSLALMGYKTVPDIARSTIEKYGSGGVGSPIRLFVNYEVNNILPLAREVD